MLEVVNSYPKGEVFWLTLDERQNQLQEHPDEKARGRVRYLQPSFRDG